MLIFSFVSKLIVSYHLSEGNHKTHPICNYVDIWMKRRLLKWLQRFSTEIKAMVPVLDFHFPWTGPRCVYVFINGGKLIDSQWSGCPTWLRQVRKQQALSCVCMCGVLLISPLSMLPKSFLDIQRTTTHGVFSHDKIYIIAHLLFI